MLNLAILMRVASCYCKQAAICAESHGCDAGWILGYLIQPLFVFTIPDVHHTIAACAMLIKSLHNVPSRS